MAVEVIEPEGGYLGEDPAFVGNAVGKNDIESGESVGGDHQEAVAKIVDIAHLAALDR